MSYKDASRAASCMHAYANCCKWEVERPPLTMVCVGVYCEKVYIKTARLVCD